MNISQIDIRTLRHIMILAKHRNYHRAADALFLSQPALTKSIQNIENTLGIPLFERLPQTVIPTSHCEIILEHAKNIFMELDEINHKLEEVSTVRRGNLDIGCGPLIARTTLPDAASNTINDYPDITVRIKTDNWRSLINMLRNGEIHLFVADIEVSKTPSDLLIEPLSATNSIVTCTKNHPLAETGSVTPNDLLKYPLAIPGLPKRGLKWVRDNTPKGMEAEEYLRRVVRFFCDSQDVVYQILEKTNHLTAGPKALFSEKIKRGELVKLELNGFTSTIQSHPGIVTLRNRTLPTAGKTFISHFRTVHANSPN